MRGRRPTVADLPEKIQQEVATYCVIARKFREELGYETEMIPEVVILGEEEDDVAQLGLVGVPVNILGDVIAAAVIDSPWGFRATRLIVSYDAYVDITRAKGGKGTKLSPAEAFEAGKPGVGEAVCVVFSSPEMTYTVIQPYRWSIVDGWEWDEMIINEGSEVFS